MKKLLALTIFVLAIIADLHSVMAGCDGARRLSCHIHCNLKGYQCNVHTCKCETFDPSQLKDADDGIRIDENFDHSVTNTSQIAVVIVNAPVEKWVYLVPAVCIVVQFILIVFVICKWGFFKQKLENTLAILSTKAPENEDRQQLIGQEGVDNNGQKYPYASHLQKWGGQKI